MALLVGLASSLPRHHSISRGKRSIRLCGSMLVEALAVVCESEFYDPNADMKKRNYEYTATDTFPEQYDSSITDFNGFVDPQTALDFLGPPRSPRSVPGPCCLKSCTFHQLYSYCGATVRRSSGEKK